ncbi:MAG: GDSL-type esterase/lipase family protein [Planctomycetota bacterium]
MKASHPRILALAIGSVLGLGLAAAAWGLRRVSYGHLVDQNEEVDSLLRERQADAARPPAGGLPLEPVDAATAGTLFFAAGPVVYDPHAYYRPESNLSLEFPLEGYPGGKYVRSTNSAGEREDHETFTAPLDLFVLVAGDSHTDGVCENRETYPNLLEERLARRSPGRSIEVLNTGTTGYSFYNYLGVLEKYAGRRPAVFITAIYGGNDFLEVLRPHRYFKRLPPPKRAPEYWKTLTSLRWDNDKALSQGGNALLLFQRYPEEAALGLEAAFEVTGEIQRRCAELGIPWLVVYIPSVYDGYTGEQAELVEHVRELLGLAEDDMRALDRLATRLLDRLRERGVDVLDLRQHLVQQGAPWYWSELHINLRAHQKIAELLEPRVEAALAPR